MNKALFAAGLVLLLFGVLLPREWYFVLTANPDLPSPPISGVSLMQLSLVAEGVVLIWLAWQPRWLHLPPNAQVLAPPAEAAPEVMDRRTAILLVVVATMIGLALRLWNIDSDLWLDEIAPLVTYRERSPLEIVSTYIAANNHLLNTLLVKLAVAMFGEREWSVRLPAALLGAATIPVCYWVARLVLTRANSVAAALLLAVSYHHIFFSQNARGYIAHVGFSLLASGLLCRALVDGRARTWTLYVITMTLNMASLLISGFVFAAHIVVGLAALWFASRAGRPVRAAGRRAATALVATAFLSFQLYALVLSQAYVYMRSVYTNAESGYALLSGEFILELLRGVLAGVGSGVGWVVWPVLMIALCLAAFGFARLFARNWVLMSSLALPGLLIAGLVLIGGLTVSPRYFLLGLPLAVLVFTEMLQVVTDRAWALLARGRPQRSSPHWLSLSVAAVISGLLLIPLVPYYAIPKQAYVASADYLRHERGPDDIVVVVHLAESGYRYYGPRFGLEAGRNPVYLRSKAALDAVVAAHTTGRVLLVTTFPRLMRVEFPDLAIAVDEGWKVVRVFPGTIGDGDIAVWVPR